jgi:transposase-like protein
MSEEQVVRAGRRHRSEFAIKQLVEEFVSGGLRQSEFCRRHSVSLNSLKRYLNRYREAGSEGSDCTLVAVELAEESAARGREPDGGGLAVVLSSGRRIEVSAGFDASTLTRLMTLLERL